MPQVDLVSDGTGAPCDGKDDPDSPAESFWLSKDAEFDWFHRNAFYKRKDSTKGMAANSTNLNTTVNSSTNNRRFPTPIKSKASIIELPVTQHCLDPKTRRNCRLGNTHLFPKQSRSVGKCGRGPSPIEPSSPKVSCAGRVRSKKDPERRKKPRGEPDRRRKSWFLSSFQLLFRSGCRECQATAVHQPTAKPHSRKRSAELKASDMMQRLPPREVGDRSEDSIPMSSLVDGEPPPSLCRTTRFTSSRRSDLWRESLNTT